LIPSGKASRFLPVGKPHRKGKGTTIETKKYKQGDIK